MLQKDSVNITKDIAKKFKEETELLKGKQQVTFRLVNSIHNGKDKKPRSYHIPNAYATNDDDGNVSEFLFYKTTKNKQTKAGAVLTEYLPPSIIFSPRGDLVVNVATDKDLIIFMLNHPRRAKNKYGDGKKRPLFYLEDKNAEARERVAAESAKARMKKLIYDEDDRLEEEELRTIARALRVSGVDQMELALVQVSIEEQCKTNPNKFLQFKGVGKDVQMMSNLQEAVEKGILKYDPLKRKWSFNNPETEKQAFIAPVRPTEDEMNALVSWLKNTDTDDTYGKIMEIITGKIQPTKEKVSEAETVLAEAETAKAEAEKAKAEAEKAKAEAEKAKAEAEIAKADAEKAKAEAETATSTPEPEAKPASGKGKGKGSAKKQPQASEA